MEKRRHDGVTTYDLLGLTVEEHNTLTRALYRSFIEYEDTKAEDLRLDLLRGARSVSE